MDYKVWSCKIVVPADAELPEGFDLPLRRAAIRAVEKGEVPVLACFSGWSGSLTPKERGIVDRDVKKEEEKEASQEAQCLGPDSPAKDWIWLPY